MIFLYILRKQIGMHKYASFLLLCGVVVCIYCISVMFGVSNGLYELENSHNINATITVDVGVETKNNITHQTKYCGNCIHHVPYILHQCFVDKAVYIPKLSGF